MQASTTRQGTDKITLLQRTCETAKDFATTKPVLKAAIAIAVISFVSCVALQGRIEDKIAAGDEHIAKAFFELTFKEYIGASAIVGAIAACIAAVAGLSAGGGGVDCGGEGAFCAIGCIALAGAVVGAIVGSPLAGVEALTVALSVLIDEALKGKVERHVGESLAVTTATAVTTFATAFVTYALSKLECCTRNEREETRHLLADRSPFEV